MNYDTWTREQLIARIRQLEAPKKDQPKKKVKPFDFSKHATRFVALRFAYLGWNYNGLAYQYEPTPLPTVEEEVLKALAQARLISSPDPGCCEFSRCGRTDRGVSAMNQVISLRVRSSLAPEEQTDDNNAREIPYITILNSILPQDIRITAVCLDPPAGFNARFSCEYRHYKYLFHRRGLDIERMRVAAAKYEGTHDFRNFCKVDGLKQITNYKRLVMLSKILHHKDDYYVFDLKGTAFLWHQVRCMVAILFNVGQGLEEPELVDRLLDVEATPRRPQFGMAHDLPLVLYDCAYPEMKWLDDINQDKAAKEYARVGGLVNDHEVKALLASMMQGFYVKEVAGSSVNVGDGKGRPFKKYVPVMDKTLGETPEVVNERFRAKRRRADPETADSAGR